jgi:hypothetical protein
MPDAQTNAARIGYAAETAYGTTIAAAPLKTLRFVEESLAHGKNAAWSNEIDSAGNRVAVTDISESAAGSFTSELSYTDFIDFLVAAIRAGAGVTTDGVTKYVNGLTAKSFYFEKQFTDITAGFIGLYGMSISEFSLALTANDIARATFGFSGKKGTKEAATRGTGAIAAPSTDPVMRSGADVANLKLDGSAFPCAVQSLTLSVQHNVRPKSELGSKSPTGQPGGTLDVSGTMRCYFPSTTLFEAMLAHTSKALTFDVANTAGKFLFDLPAITLGAFTPPAGPVNSDVIVDIPFMAVKGGSGSPYTIAISVDPAGA